VKNSFLVSLILAFFLSSCVSQQPKIVKQVIRDTVIINSQTDKYESVRMAKLDRFKISTSKYPSKGQDERVRFLILHYTALNDSLSLKVLTQQEVSAHYLIPSDYSDSIYLLVDETKRSWHAGVSYWKGINNLNFSSIGIEIVNQGYTGTFNTNADGTITDTRYFYDFPPHQIEKVAALCKDLITRYKIDPVNVLGHSDIAPGRKHDPGPKFPWKLLYEKYRIGAWYEDFHKQTYLSQFPYAEFNSYVFIQSVQADLEKYGYEIQKTGAWDAQTQKVIQAFQYHFRPEKYDGILDAETWAILKALILKYRQ